MASFERGARAKRVLACGGCGDLCGSRYHLFGEFKTHSRTTVKIRNSCSGISAYRCSLGTLAYDVLIGMKGVFPWVSIAVPLCHIASTEMPHMRLAKRQIEKQAAALSQNSTRENQTMSHVLQ